MKKNLFILILFSLLPVITWAQESISVKGVVFDNLNMTVPGASVVEKGTQNGTVTDMDGNFTLQAKKGSKLVVSFIGYKTVEITATDKQVLKIILNEDSQTLDEVVVTGYSGTQLRSKTTNSIAKVKQETLNVGLFSNPAQALSGAVSGLKVIQSSGSPGAAPTIVLRGGTNLDGTGSPLVIVDGQLRDGLIAINPEDIESMEVMKDAGATAIYGARASNGVILVTTKKGKAGHREINFKAKVGLNYAYMPYEFLNGGEYISALRQAVYNAGNLFTDKNGTVKGYGPYSGGSLEGAQPYGTGNVYGKSVYSPMFLSNENANLLENGWQKMTDPITGKEIIYKDTDLASYNLNNPSLTQDYNINMSGGNDRATYYAGLGYNHQEAVPINTYYERYSFVTNASYKIADWLTSKSSLNYNRANWKNMPGSNGSEANYFGRIMSLPPTVIFEDEEGNMQLGPGTMGEF